MKALYFDYCASSPSYPEVNQSVFDVSNTIFANPSSHHEFGYESKKIVENSRAEIAKILNVEDSEVIFTSGATESNNLAVFGALRFIINNELKREKLHVVVSEIEHPSIYSCYKILEDSNIEVTYLPVDQNGVVSLSSLKSSIKENTVLVSVMHVNNEIGSIQPIEQIGKYLSQYDNIFFHVDGVQGFGKVDLDLSNIDLYTLSGHKFGGPKGTGLLIVKNSAKISPLFQGGGQEFGIRSGTINVPGVVGLSLAMKMAVSKKKDRIEKLAILNSKLYTELDKIPQLVINSPKPPFSTPHIINFSYPSVPSSFILNNLSKKGIIASSQSACSSKSKEPSRVLMAMGRDEKTASSSIRISLHETISMEEIEYLVESISNMINELSEIEII